MKYLALLALVEMASARTGNYWCQYDSRNTEPVCNDLGGVWDEPYCTITGTISEEDCKNMCAGETQETCSQFYWPATSDHPESCHWYYCDVWPFHTKKA